MRKKELQIFLTMVLYCIKISYKASPFYTVVRVVVHVAVEVLGIIATYVAAGVMNILAGNLKGNAAEIICVLFMVMLLVEILSKLFNDIKSYCSGMHETLVSNYLNMYIMEKAAKADIEFYDSPDYYDMITAVKDDSHAVGSIVWNIINGLGSLVAFISAFFILSHRSYVIALIISAAVIPLTIVEQKFTKNIYNWELRHIKEQRKMGYLQYILSAREYTMDIRLFDIGGYLIHKYENVWGDFFQKRRKIAKKQTVYVFLLGILPEICTIGVMFCLAQGILQGNGKIGEYTLYTGLIAKLVTSSYVIVNVWLAIYSNKLKMENIKKFDKIENKINNDGLRKLTGDVSIEFRNVSFCYPGTDKPVLNNVSFKIDKRERACIVGVNGAGKSTIMKLILRFYDVTEGEILVNDINIKEYEICHFRRAFNVLFQSITNYSFTLKDNVMLSDIESATKGEEEVYKALKRSDAWEFVQKFPEGLEQYVTKNFDEDGIELSGGQYQKLALARMYYRDSQVVLLDEPSAALDPEAEFKLFRYLEEYCEDRTTIFTSHRLSNIHLANHILLMEEGRLIEEGRHTELMERNGRYAQLYNYQAQKFKQ